MNVRDGGIRRTIYSMIVPITIENILQMSTGIVSMAMIGRISVTAVTIQGLCSRLTGILWCIFKGLSIGTSVFVARYYGARDMERVKKVSQQSILFSVVLAFILQILIYFQGGNFLKLFNPGAGVMQEATFYLRVVSIGLVFQGISLITVGIMQGLGDAKIPMIISFVMNVVNIICGYILIFGHMGFNEMGIKGAAIALVLAQGASAALNLYVLFNRDGILYTMRNKDFFKFDMVEIGRICKIGTPSAFEDLFWQFSAIILTKVVLSFGEVPFAAHQLGLQAESLSEMPSLGFGVAATTFVGQALGANNRKLGKSYVDEITKGALIIMSIGSLLLILFPKQVMQLLTDEKDVIELGAIYVRLMGFIQIPQNLSRVFNGALKAAGYTRLPMLVAGIGLWGIRIPLSLILTYVFDTTIVTIWIIIAIDQLSRFILSFILYKSKNIFADYPNKVGRKIQM